MIKTIAKNRTKKINEILDDSDAIVKVYSLNNDFSGKEVSADQNCFAYVKGESKTLTRAEWLKNELTSMSFAKLKDNGNNVYQIDIHSNMWIVIIKGGQA